MEDVLEEKNNLILIVDDDPDFREILSLKFSAAGFKTASAENGEEGFRKAKELRPRLVLLDVEMPVRNGVETFLKMQEDPEMKNIKCLFLTGYGDAHHAAAGIDNKVAQEIGALDYIKKSDDLDSIVSKIRAFL